MNDEFSEELLVPIPKECPQCGQPTQPHIPFCERCKFDLRYDFVRKDNQIRPCAFCGELRKMTGEHFFPDWLRDYYEPPRQYEHIVARPERLIPWVRSPMRTTPKRETAAPYGRKVFNVCSGCNNGWMSRLQNEAKPMILQLANGGWPKLSEPERLTLSRWCAMTAMNIEYHGGIVTSEQSQRDALRLGQMPGGWRIAIARFADTRAAGHYWHRAMMSYNQLTLQSSYVCIERFGVYVMSAGGDPVLELVQISIGVDFDDIVRDHRLRQIWPVEHPGWSPDHMVIAEADLVAIQSQF